MRTIVALMWLPILAGAAYAQQPSDTQSVKVGPWAVATTYKGDRFESCTMTRSTSDMGIVFVRNRQGLLLSLDSPGWKLERGKAYSVQLSAGSRTVDAQALAESKSVTIAFADAAFNERLRTANALEVRGEGATLRVPLDGSAAGLGRLDVCFEKNLRESPDTNRSSRRPENLESTRRQPLHLATFSRCFSVSPLMEFTDRMTFLGGRQAGFALVWPLKGSWGMWRAGFAVLKPSAFAS